MKKTRLNPVSKKQKIELQKRRQLKAQLIKESGGRCQKCGKLPDWRGLALHHEKFLSRGGGTRLDNVILVCYSCHSKKHNIKEV